MADTQTYYERNKERVRARAKEYYLRLTEGKVTRRNQKHDHADDPQEKRPRGRPRKEPTEQKEKRPRGRPFKDAENVARVEPLGGDAYLSPPSSDDIIFEDIANQLI